MSNIKQFYENLSRPIDGIKGIGKAKASALERLGIQTFSDLLFHLPRNYEDLRTPVKIRNLVHESKSLVKATIILATLGRGFGRRRTFSLLTEDDSGRMEVVFFHGGYLEKTLTVGREVFFYGKVKIENGRRTMLHPTVISEEQLESGILPIYPLTAGIGQRELRKWIRTVLDLIPEDAESLPAEIIKKARLTSIKSALESIHFPEDSQKFKESRFRLVYQEIFELQMALTLLREDAAEKGSGTSFRAGNIKEFIDSLPYTLTDAQKRTVDEIEEDMNSDRPMNRLVQGDVGSGKTVVAQAALYKAASCGYQGIMMAPTEILARQHYENFRRDFESFGLEVRFLGGLMPAAEKRETLADIKSGKCDIIVGTHAVISEGVEYAKPGIVITDEQHRFGVNQRMALAEKGDFPDVLIMTATPIPRTLAVIIYGDMDISIIDELPPGRKEIKTELYTEKTRSKAYEFVRSEVKKGRQAYIVAPLIEESEFIESRSAKELYKEMLRRFPGIKTELLHGEMKSAEKDAVMERFYAGEISVLVSTVVIEVGINVPNASVMLIENAERFGLSQLHQLRGRVGRGVHDSYCIIITAGGGEIAAKRAETLAKTSDGFLIAEEDLKLRGPGEFFGVKQHGMASFSLADPIKHMKLFESARKDAAEFLEGLDSQKGSDLQEGLDSQRSSDPQKASEEAEFVDLIKEKFSLRQMVL